MSLRPFLRRLFGPLMVVLVLCGFAGSLWTFAANEAESKKDEDDADKDYADELPRIPATEPEEALKTFQLRPGFQLEIVACEPLIRDPVAIDFDEQGRMYVCEMPEYNQYANEKGYKGKGSVKQLIDTDWDGRYDEARLFVAEIDSPTSVLSYDGGVFVGSVPDIWYFKDTDNDGVADIKEKIFTGFARDPAGEAMLNSFRWGLDNKVHLSTNLAGGEVKAVADENAQPVSVRGQGFIFDPRERTFELTSGGGQHGLGIDDWGQKYVCDNSNPAQVITYDNRYLRRNPYLAAPNAAVNVTEGKFTPVFRISDVEPWRKLRTRLRSKGVIPGSDEGGAPAGFFTGATGVTIYRGDAYGKEYHGNLFVGEVSGNLVYRARMERDGLTNTAYRADEDVEFLASTDNWFRPVQFGQGPDGCLYVIDMYRELIEGAAFLAPPILKHLDVSSGIDRGRIYRIVPENFERRPRPELDKATTKELVDSLLHPNGWTRDTASRVLYERQDPAAVELLRQRIAFSTACNPQLYVHALYSLESLGALEPKDLIPAFDQVCSPWITVHALRLAEKYVAKSPALRDAMLQLLDAKDLIVVEQLAYSLGAFHTPARDVALATLAKQYASEPMIALAIQSSLAQGAGDVFQALIADDEFRQSTAGPAFLASLAGLIGAANQTADVATVLAGINGLPEEAGDLAQNLVAALANAQPEAARAQITGAGGGKAAALVQKMIADAKEQAFAEEAEVPARVSAIRTLGLASFDDLEESLTGLLDLRQPQPVQSAALETLAKFKESAVATILIDAWPTLSPQLRANATETLFSRPEWVQLFLDAVEAGTIPPNEIDPVRVQLLKQDRNEEIAARATALFKETLSKRADVVAAYQDALKMKGDAAEGKAIFKKECSACHKLEGVGNEVGADLSAVRNRGLDAVLLNILDPNREVKPQYVGYVLVTDEGLTVTGMIVEETANSVTIRRADGTTASVLRVHIDELRSTGLSFMPEGLEKQLDVKKMADLLAYLNSIK
ncbi:MAG: c-type cytochrome [Planctomycetota bacterium]|nr:c-type cytochrome [Planctomycetota bacterium]MDA1211241.1 c-type cytochrome [Planctomycetota bacterium]